MSADATPTLPEYAPKTGNRLTRWMGRLLMRAIGWRVRGNFPNCRQLLICGAPHTSNWDFVITLLASMEVGLRFSYLMKKEAFFWPFKGLFLSFGGIPLDRSDAAAVVDQITQWYREHEQVWLAITPDGTRARVEKWKTGFVRIAHEAKAPVLIVSWNYPDKTLYIDRLWHTTGDHEKDALEIRDYVNGRFVARFPQNQ